MFSLCRCALTVMTVFAPHILQAQEDRWLEVSSGSERTIEIDRRSVQSSTDGITRVWIRETYREPETTADGRYFTVAVFQMDMNCREKRTLRLSMTYYDHGKVVGGYNGGGEWKPVVPDSYGEIQFEAACAMHPPGPTLKILPSPRDHVQ